MSRTTKTPAAKTSAKKAKVKDNVIPLLRVEEVDRMSLLLSSSEVQRLGAQADLAVAQADKMIAELDKDGRVREAMMTAQRFRHAQQIAQQKYFAVMRGVEAKLGVSLEKYAMNPDTGVVHPISPTTPSVDPVHTN